MIMLTGRHYLLRQLASIGCTGAGRYLTALCFICMSLIDYPFLKQALSHSTLSEMTTVCFWVVVHKLTALKYVVPIKLDNSHTNLFSLFFSR